MEGSLNAKSSHHHCERSWPQPPPEVAAQMEAHGVLPPITLYIEAP